MKKVLQKRREDELISGHLVAGWRPGPGRKGGGGAVGDTGRKERKSKEMAMAAVTMAEVNVPSIFMPDFPVGALITPLCCFVHAGM